MAILVTGASGFVGRALLRTLHAHGCPVRAVARTTCSEVRERGHGDWIHIAELGPDTDWTAALEGVDAVVHLAARVHLMRDAASDPLAAYRRVNLDGTRALAEAAVRLGVKRFVFVSSVKVNGEQTFGLPFSERDPPRPADPYAVSKWEAELALADIARHSGTETVVLRCPLVFGPGVGANFRRLLQLAASGLPLPLASIDNRRSMIGVDNLADAILTALRVPQAAGRTFLLSDGDWSTPDMIRGLAQAMERPTRLFPCSPGLLRRAFALIGQSATADRLLQSLQVDSGSFRALGWRPPVSRDEALRRVARWHRDTAV